MSSNESDYFVSWNAIISQATKASSLKFTLASCLLDIATIPGNSKAEVYVDTNELAKRFIEYYWYQVVRFKLRQAPAQVQEPKVSLLLQEISNKEGAVMRGIQDLNPEQAEALTNVTADRGFYEVLKRFHNVRSRETKKIFFRKLTRGIVIPVEATVFLALHEPLLRSSVLFQWALYLEKFNETPRILSKIKYKQSHKRTSLTKYRNLLSPFESNCFYCGEQLVNKICVDHFIPHSYLFEDELWNLVLSCAACNNKKGNILPSAKLIVKLQERNNLLSKSTGKASKEIDKSLNRMNSKVDFVEYVELICHQAERAGFTTG